MGWEHVIRVNFMISIVVCTYNRAESLRTTLESLAQMEVPADVPWELIVVDNNSKDGTRAVVEEFGQTSRVKIRYVFERKQGKSYALNRGVKESRTDIIAFTDDDVRVSPGWLAELVRTFKEFDCMGVAGRIIPAWEDLQRPAWLISTGPYGLSPGPLADFNLGDVPKPTRVPGWGANMAFRKSAFEKYGLFRTDLGPSGGARRLGEDTEFGRRLIRAGETVMYSSEAIIRHPVDEKRLRKTYFLSYYFSHGKASVQEERWPAEAVLWFGVPRYIFRSLLESCAKWLTSLESAKRFYYKAQVYRSLGQIAEARRLLADERTEAHNREDQTEGHWT